jgi:putative hydrolase of the HAD superfamily
MIFDASCFSCDIGCEKPAREAYSAIITKLRASPEHSVYVGDGGSGELRGAKEAGFARVIYMKGFVSKNVLRTAAELEQFQSTADKTIANLSDLILIVEEF